MIKKLIYLFLLLLVLSIITIFYCNKQIKSAVENKLYTNVDSIPFNKTGLLLGTAKYLKNKEINPFYLYRIDAAESLLKHNKIKYIIVSGDNHISSYDEPTEMKKDLIARGIDSTKIYLDYAGFRTFDSMIRLKEIFGQDSVTIISQQFHNERALFIAQKQNIYAIAFNAKDVTKKEMPFRERLARVKVFIDYLFGNKPHFLGKKITLPN